MICSTMFRKIIFAVMLFVSALFLLEIALRAGGALYLNLKYPSKPVKADPGSFKILCLGDSFTQGFGAPVGKSYPEQLEELLKGQANKNVTVYKEFHINSSTVLKCLKKDIGTYNPDLIIIMTGCNDLWNMENCSDSAFGDSSFLESIDISCSGSRVYKLIKISFLNLRAFLSKKDFKFIEKEDIENTLRHFSVPEAEEHFILGDQHMYKGAYESALEEFNIAETLEPRNPWVHWRKGCIYLRAIPESDLCVKEFKLALQYGDSSVVGYVFAFLYEFYRDYGKAYAIMEPIIDANYNGEEKIKAKRCLKRLYLLYSEEKCVEKVIAYNLKETIKIIKGKNIKVVLMNYPAIVAPHVKMIAEKAGKLFNVVVVDNNEIFTDKLKVLNEKDLFIADGHCNANGYKLIAENLCKTLIKGRMLDDSPE